MGLSAPLAPGWGAGYLLRAGEGQPSVSSAQQRRVPVAEAGVNAATVPATRFVTFAEQGEKANLGPEWPMPTLPTQQRPSSLLRSRDAAGNELARTAPQTLLPRGHGAQIWRDCLISRALPDRSKSHPQSLSSLCRSTSKPLPYSPPCLRVNWMLPPMFRVMRLREQYGSVSLEISGMAALTSIGETIQLSVTANMSDGSRQAVGNALLQWHLLISLWSRYLRAP